MKRAWHVIVRRRFAPVLATGVCAVALAVAGCGGGSSNSTAPGSGSKSTASSENSPALSKSAYQQQAVAVFQPVLQALNGVRNNETSSSSWGQLSTVTQKAHDQIATLSAPSQVADLHKQLVSQLNSIASDAGKVRDDLSSQNRNSLQTDASSVVQDGQALKTLAASYQSRGYAQLAAVLQ